MMREAGLTIEPRAVRGVAAGRAIMACLGEKKKRREVAEVISPLRRW